MIDAVLLSLGIGAGGSWCLMGLSLLAFRRPLWAAVTIGLLLMRAAPRRQTPDEAAFCRAVAAELRGGASLRSSLARAAQQASIPGRDAVRRSCDAGRPLSEVSAVLSDELPVVGRAAGAALVIGADTGGNLAGAFDALALWASDELQLERRRREAAVQATSSARIIAALPVALIGFLVVSGRWRSLLAGGAPALVMATAGSLLMLVGLTLIWWMTKAART